ncbi:MAG: hypothetical protein ACKOGA_23230, partial [Planctomycetaceae bacterium]
RDRGPVGRRGRLRELGSRAELGQAPAFLAEPVRGLDSLGERDRGPVGRRGLLRVAGFQVGERGVPSGAWRRVRRQPG